MTSDFADVYQRFPDSVFGSEFWDFYKVIWEAEQQFNLPFRYDHGVAVWTANRVKTYYSTAKQLGLYDEQKPAIATAISVGKDDELLPLAPVDIYFETGATGAAASNRKRPFGCVYSERIVKRLLDQGHKILLLRDDPGSIASHPNLQAISNAELRERIRRIAADNKVAPVKIDAAAIEYWSNVSSYFRSELDVDVFDPEGVAALVTSHKRQYKWHRSFLEALSPNAYICMAHYYRAAPIEAAKSLRIWTVDYQHGINSRYHLGYGYPNICPEERKIPYYPNEFWGWGNVWHNSEWFPSQCCQVRNLGHYDNQANTDHKFGEKQKRTILIATSWAMRKRFLLLAKNIAEKYPDWKICIKLHPREHEDEYAELTSVYPSVQIISGDTDIFTAAKDVEYVISICSSALFDVLLCGCKIAVMNAPAAEYAEDFVTQFGVPVLEQDASNFSETIAGMDKQNIPIEAVFYTPNSKDWELLSDSLQISSSYFILSRPINPPQNTFYKERKFAEFVKKSFAGENGEIDALAPSNRFGSRAFLSPYYRKYYTREVDIAAREQLLNLKGLDRQVQAFTNLLSSGVSPARHVKVMRSLIVRSKQEKRPELNLQILRAVFADKRIENSIFHAEILENWFALDNHQLPNGNKTSARLWHDAALYLEELSQLTAKLTRIYREISVEAKEEYGDTRVSNSDQDRLREQLIFKLKNKLPFTMMRIGDGEVYAFDPDYVDRDTLDDDRLHRENIWWGEGLDSKLRLRLREGAQEAICKVDMLGIPSIYRLLRDLPRQLRLMRGPVSEWPRTGRAHLILFNELARLSSEGKLDWSKKTLLDDRCHQELFVPSRLADFHFSDRPIVLVNCFSSDQINSALGTNFFSDEIRLPPHTKVRSHVLNDSLASTVTPLILDELLAQIDEKARDNAVFFVGGGFVGKLLIGRIAELGYTALDIGAAADYWMGIQTRGPLDFSQF